MDFDKYLEGQSMQRPPLFERDCFIYWKNRFETYVKAKDLDLLHIILNGDFLPVANNEVTQVLEVVPFEQQNNDLKRKPAKNNKAKMVIYNTFSKQKYERTFMCKMAKDIWKSLLITHQVTAAKLPVLNPNEFELWKMRIEQYFLMTDFALWEVILNGDSPLPTRSIDGVETPYPPTTVEEKLPRKNKLKV
nr:DUF4219 domain-containing protein/UBN2 domain-containing protein [Tanacetum cinerariifolium]